MRSLPDNAFDLAIVDPPYGIDVTSMNMGGRKTIRPDKTKSWDNAIPNQDYFDELNRVSKNQIIWGGNYFPLPPTRCWLMWDKGESMYGRDFAEAEMAWTNFDKVVRLYKQNPNQLDRIHPTQKPVKLYEWLLTNYAKQGDKILDTHLGSGSHAIACNNLGFELVGLELDRDYFKASCERIAKETQQERLF
jgi:site-specific DNA-methyltransferase (adenine-specific)